MASFRKCQIPSGFTQPCGSRHPCFVYSTAFEKGTSPRSGALPSSELALILPQCFFRGVRETSSHALAGHRNPNQTPSGQIKQQHSPTYGHFIHPFCPNSAMERTAFPCCLARAWEEPHARELRRTQKGMCHHWHSRLTCLGDSYYHLAHVTLPELLLGLSSSSTA